MDKNTLISKLSPPLNRILIKLLIQEFIEMERRFILQDWEPATLDGGQFSEILARIIYHVDSGIINQRKGFNSCLQYIEDQANSNLHNFPKRRTAIHMCKVLRTVYKFRSQRGAVHIDPDYTANEIDSTMLIANVRWLMAETLRVFWTGDKKVVATSIQEIVQYNVPAVLSIDNRDLVLRTDCSVEEEILLVLHNRGNEGLNRNEIGCAIPKAASTISNALTRLAGATQRAILLRENGNYILTPNGSRRIYEELAPKLTLS